MTWWWKQTMLVRTTLYFHLVTVMEIRIARITKNVTMVSLLVSRMTEAVILEILYRVFRFLTRSRILFCSRWQSVRDNWAPQTVREQTDGNLTDCHLTLMLAVSWFCSLTITVASMKWTNFEFLLKKKSRICKSFHLATLVANTFNILTWRRTGLPELGSRTPKGSRNDLQGAQRVYHFLQESVKFVFSLRPLTVVKNSCNSAKRHS